MPGRWVTHSDTGFLSGPVSRVLVKSAPPQVAEERELWGTGAVSSPAKWPGVGRAGDSVPKALAQSFVTVARHDQPSRPRCVLSETFPLV